MFFDLTNHMEWIGLSDPLSKLYTLTLDGSNNSQVFKFRQTLTSMDIMFILLLDQSSKFQFSRSISGFVPKQSRSFYGSNYTVDGQPLFYGLITLINHYQPFIEYGSSSCMGLERSLNDSGLKSGTAKPLARLLNRMSMYIKCTIDQITGASSTNSGDIKIRPQDLTLELANMILSMVELIRIGRLCLKDSIDDDDDGFQLPEFLLNTFQFTICHLNGAKRAP